MDSKRIAQRTIGRLTRTPTDWIIEMQWRDGETPDEYHARLSWLPSGLTRAAHVVTLPNRNASEPPFVMCITYMDMDEL